MVSISIDNSIDSNGVPVGRPHLEPGTYCYWLKQLREANREYRPVIIVENQSGYYALDFTYGTDKEIAEETVRQLNAELGMDRDRVLDIVTSSMRRSGEDKATGFRRIRRHSTHKRG